MEEKKLIKKDPELFPIAKYNFKKFSEEHSVVFTGSPIQHPYDDEKFILISDPLSDHTHFYEFSKADVISIEDLPKILSPKGESIQISKVWITAGVIAVKYEPFIVGKTNQVLQGIK